VILLRHPRLGEYSGLDFERFREGAEAEDGYGLFRAALEDVGEEALSQILSSLDVIVESIRRADSVLTENAGGETGTNFTATYESIASIRRSVAQFSSGDSGTDGAPAGDASGAGASMAQAAGAEGSVGGRIDTREDVLRALEAIGDYYRRREPGSPVPLALARARDWVNADFLTVLEDIAPGGMDEVRRVLVRSPKPDE
jgi:type VI secretion system protein ImpA